MREKALRNLLFKDVENENETKKGAILLRMYAIIMCVYLLAISLTFIGVGKIFILAPVIPCFVLYCLSVYITYHNGTKYATWLTFITTMLWILSMVYLLGWDSGVQHLLFVLVALCFILNTRSQEGQCCAGSAALSVPYRAVLLLQGKYSMVHDGQYGGQCASGIKYCNDFHAVCRYDRHLQQEYR